MKKSYVKALALLLAIIMMLGVAPLGVFAETIISALSAEKPVYVLAGSDFQPNDDNVNTGASQVTKILNAIKGAGYTAFDGFLFAGDYEYSSTTSSSESIKGKNALTSAVQAIYGTGMDEVYAQGNHDPDSLVGTTLSPSGANDADGYGVFVINEKDYMWKNDNESTIKATAANLEAYLNEKLEADYDKPIFVISHLPLHYSMRTRSGGGDGKHANYLFDVLNAAGEQGLNIIFLYGHDHSHGWDDYLGGAAVYLQKGDSINIAQNSTTNYKQETLAFTYMNAGFVGYYGTTGSSSSIDSTLTMTVFVITEGQVKIERYSADGLHNLKSKGIKRKGDSSSYTVDPYDADTTVYTSPQYITWEVEKPLTVTDATGTVTVTAPDITAVTASKTEQAKDGYAKYVVYDINVDGYTQGNEATVTIKLDNGFVSGVPVTVFDVAEGTSVVKEIVDGTVTFTTNHFSEFAVGQADMSEPETDTKDIPGRALEAVSSLTSGQYYVIVNDRNGYVLTSEASGNKLKLDTTEDYSHVWYYVADKNNYYLRTNPTDSNNYLRIGSETAGLEKKKNSGLTLSYNSDSKTWTIRGVNSRQYLNQYGGPGATVAGGYGTGHSDAGSRWRIYKVVETDPATVTLNVAPGRVSLRLGATFNLAPSVTVNGSATSDYAITWTSSDDDSVVTVDNGELKGISEGIATVTATLTAVNGEEISSAYRPTVQIQVTVVDKSIASATIDRETATVNYGSKTTASTGAVIEIIYDDGTTDKIPVTVSMLEGDFNLRKTGTYEGLTVMYNGRAVTESFTLTVTAVDYPHYPNQGAVRVNKTATGIDFQASGLARVELSATGVPVKKGVDVIVMLDMSSSMDNTVGNSTRINVLKNSMQKLIAQLKGTGEEELDTRIAVANFFRYYLDEGSDFYLDKNDHLAGGSIRTNDDYTPTVFTGDGSHTEKAFVPVAGLANTEFDSVLTVDYTHSGTNYDYAFEVIYRLGSAIKAANEAAGEERDLYVIFMSDGAPFQYNYFSADSSETYWNNWLQGTVTDNMLYRDAHNQFYNEEGKHWMAEAIKGDPAEDYQVIRKNVSKDGFTTVKGLGATMYSIGFCLTKDKEITLESMDHVLSNIASSPATYHKVNSADGLNNAFTAIGGEIAYAASEARFVDTMGAHFDLKLGNHTYTVIENGMPETRTSIPDIVVRAYDIYTRDDVRAGLIDEAMIGVRKGTSNELEKVTFNDDGTEVYSTAVSGDIKINILKDDGVIYAKNFFYNTTATAVMIDTNGDGTTDYSLAPETFYWKMGTVNTTELALSYYVYLTGALEGKAEEGSYETNESAILYYKNWVGNDCQMPTVSPVMPWGSANVSYGFYLVNEYGQPINAKREVVSFANRVIVIPAALYAKINLNNNQEINALNVTAGHVLPQGCELYDTAASYLVEIHSAGGGKWEITKGDGLANTTYVTGFSGDTFSNALTENSVSTDYTHTTVWFAVKFDAKTTDDAVVIDYGSPVDVDILSNDIFYNVGTLEGISLNGGEFGTQYGKTVEGKFGTFEIVGGKLRYTPTTMGMTEPEEIYYAVYFHSNEEFSGYFYGKLTVIPATIMYFEDSFVKYVDSTAAADGSDMGKWAPVGQDMPIIQSEDRVGIANNVYGYDPMNNGFTTYSSGSAMSVTVDAATATPNNDYKNSAHATFTFTGTGFDIISLTNSTTDMILITVEKDGVELVNTMVDNYYGYTYSAEDDVWTATPSDEAVWQVPVIKIDMADKVEEAYGTYTVNIYVYHHMFLDHDDSGSCTFILDAIRIYNPAKGNADAENAYKADGEYNPTYTVVKDLILAADNLTDANTINGVVFIDGKNATDKVADYTNPGPNYETYLANEQSVSFKLTADAIPASVQIGAKLAFGAKATLAMGMLKDGKEVIKYVDLNTATDMYYVLLTEKDWHLTEDGTYVTDTITLANSSEGAVISLTNLKFTQSTADEKAAVNAIVDEAVVADAGVMMFSLFRAPVIEETEPETEAPTEPETEAPTEPETETPTEPETEAPTEAPTDEVTEAPETNAPEQGGDATQAPDGEQTTAPAKEGCGSVIGFSAIAILAAAAAVVALKKD